MIDINYYVKKRQKGADYSEIRKELTELGYSKEEITQTVSAIDDKFVRLIEEKKNKNIANIINGIIRVTLGIFLLLYSVWLIIGGFNYGLGFLDVIILIFSLSTGYWFFQTGKNMLRLALKPKEKTETEDDILY